jgi:SAM-dependent methyltransferase
MTERVPRWQQREKIRARGGRRLSGENAGRWRPGRDADDGCLTGHPMLFDVLPAFELLRMPEGGGYPVGFIELAARLMGCSSDLDAIVHLCSGSIAARRSFDLREASAAAVRADVRELPIASSSVRWVMADPPYDRDYAEELWGTGKQYPTPAVLLREISRILVPGGRAAFLHQLVPGMPVGLKRIALYGVTTGIGYRIRALSIVERIDESELQ